MNIDDEEIYFGGNYVTMYPVTGKFIKFSEEKVITNTYSKEEAEKTVKYMEDLSYIKSEYKDHYIPCVPETNIEVKEDGEGVNHSSTQAQSSLSESTKPISSLFRF